MTKKTLGGDRLGSGKKMEVTLHGYERSTHDLSYLFRSTMSAGTLVPFMNEVALPGDTFDIDLDCLFMTHPTVGPLLGSYKIQLDVFQAPIRLYNSLLHNNMLGIGMEMSKVKLPQIGLTANPINGVEDKDNAQINPSCLLSYLGIRGVGYTSSDQTRYFNAVPLLAYWEIYKNYYSNKQEKKGAVIHTSVASNGSITKIEVEDGTTWTISYIPTISPMTDLTPTSKIIVTYTTFPDPNRIMFNLSGRGQVSFLDLVVSYVDTGTTLEGYYNYSKWGMDYIQNWETFLNTGGLNVSPVVTLFDLDNIDDMRKAVLAFQSEAVSFKTNTVDLAPYNYLNTVENLIYNRLKSQEGLGVKTYQSDLFNNWLNLEWLGAISDASAVSTVGDQFTIDQLILSKKVYEMLNRIAVSGGSYDDWLDAVYDHDRIRRAESPIYHGGLIRELVFQEVVSNAGTTEQTLGTLAGKGVMAKSKKGGSVVIRVDEPSYIMGIVSLTPRIDYSQGNKWDVNLETMDDLHKPALDEIGFQDLITEQMAYWDTYWDGTKWVQKSAGKQPAWVNYMTNVNVTRGNFAIPTNEMFMTLNRRYEWSSVTNAIKDVTTYIDPTKFNFVFAQTALDAQNFWCQISVDMKVRRKMSAKIMPNL